MGKSPLNVSRLDVSLMLDGISIVCFASSYAIALCLEVSRLFFRISLWTAIMIGFVAAGMVAHTIFLVREVWQRGGLAAIGSWYLGSIAAAWILAAIYLARAFRKPPTAMGLFLLPTSLALVGLAHIFPHSQRGEADFRLWGMIHGIALLLGSGTVFLGTLGGILYLWQSYRLKHKQVSVRGLKLPSLERLQSVSEGSLVVSSCLLSIGLVAGLLLNWHAGERVPWTDPVVWPSGVLLLWLLSVLSFNTFYRPARQGRKIAYLVVANFVFLGMVFAVLKFYPSSHRFVSPKTTTSLAEMTVSSPPCCHPPLEQFGWQKGNRNAA